VTIRAPSSLRQFLGPLIPGIIFPEGYKRLGIEPERAAILIGQLGSGSTGPPNHNDESESQCGSDEPTAWGGETLARTC
jgi:hypothetical protein